MKNWQAVILSLLLLAAAQFVWLITLKGII
jgi:hypothetical protein